MNNKTKAFIGSIIGVLIGTQYELYQLYKHVDEIEAQKVKLKRDLFDAEHNNIILKSNYATLYYHMTDEEKEKFRLLYPFKIPPFIAP